MKLSVCVCVCVSMLMMELYRDYIYGISLCWAAFVAVDGADCVKGQGRVRPETCGMMA